MSFDLDQSSPECSVVIGPDAVTNLRADSPEVPIVALVDAASPIQAVLAQAAGADIVLPTPTLDVHAPSKTPGLALAMSAACTIAHQRRETARSSRQVGHDLAGALNVIGLAAEVGTSGSTGSDEALAHILSLAKAAGADSWRAGRADRSSRRSLTAVDVVRLVRGPATAGDDVEVTAQTGRQRVFADERQLTGAVAELILNARRSGAKRIRVDVCDDGDNVVVIVNDDGPGFTPEQRQSIGEPHIAPTSSSRPGLGLATIAEFASDLGGSFTVVDHDEPGWSVSARLSLPRLDSDDGRLAAGVIAVDQATAQANILERVVRHAPVTESLDAIVTAIENQLPDTTCSVLLLRDGLSLHHGAGARLPAAYRHAIDGVAIGRGQGSCGTAAFTGRPVVASDVTTDRNWIQFRDVATDHGLRSCWSTPIVAAQDGEVLGTFAVYKSSVWRPDQAAFKLVKRFTYLAAVAIEHHRLFEALAESESRFRSAFEGATAGLALVDLEGSMLMVNPSLSAMVAQPESILLSANLLDLVDSASRAEIREAWDVLADGDITTPNSQPSIEVPLVPAQENGPQVWVSLSTSIIAAGAERNLYVEVRDITSRRRHLEGQRAREAAEASNRAKNDFLALVSHELRTPLNAILGFAQVMQLADLDLDADQRAESVEQIVRAGEHLRDLIDQLLDLSRIEAGQLAVRTEHVDIDGVICEAIDLVGPLAMSRNISLVADRRSAEQHQVLADRRCLRQVLINLLGNAVKYTPANGTVDVDAHAVSDGKIRITVNDTGPGIARESIDELFQPFHRLVPEADGRSEGTGLGLALTARLMEEMGGAIGVNSTVGVGSSFWVEFPTTAEFPVTTDRVRRPVELPSSSLEPSPLDDAASHAGVLLYIEDDEACVGVIEAALESRPLVELRTARSAADGERHLLADDIDLVLLDIGLPDRSGWDLLRDIRATTPDLPVMVLTANVDTTSGATLDHDKLFIKPLDIPDALRAIDLVLARSPDGHDLGQAFDSFEQ